MSLFQSQAAYDRRVILQQADRAASRKRRRKAIRLYRRILAVEANSHDVHRKLAPLLAHKKQRFDAWLSYKDAARGLMQEGKASEARETLREAVRMLPRELEAWTSLAAVERREGQNVRAVAVLTQGARQFKSRALQPMAIRLLRMAREIDPWKVEVVLPLARLLARNDQKEEALTLLRNLSSRVRGEDLRRVRKAQWRLLPSLVNTWQLMLGTSGGAPRPSRSSSTGRKKASAK